MRKKISLQEALCGFNMNIKTLQKEARFVPITTEPGQVIQDKMLYRIPNEGKCSKIFHWNGIINGTPNHQMILDQILVTRLILALRQCCLWGSIIVNHIMRLGVTFKIRPWASIPTEVLVAI